MKISDATQLFLEKEGKELMGKHYINFFVLIFIFLLAILSIGFGSASIKYLKHKMDDPFINWVDVIVRQKVTDKSSKMALNDFLNNKEYQQNIGFTQPDSNYVLNIDFHHQKKNKSILLEGRSIKAQSNILDKILDSSNVVEKGDFGLSDNGLGIIITQGALLDLGYENIPPFVELSLPFDKPSCDDLNIPNGVNGYYPVSFPLVAVVKQLPGMYSFMFTDRFLHDYCAQNATSWDITSEENNQVLCLVGCLLSLTKLKEKAEDKGFTASIDDYVLTCKNNLKKLTITYDSYSDNLAYEFNELYNEIKVDGIYRLYDFQTINDYRTDNPSYLSVQIEQLSNIRKFQSELYDKCGIKLEMASVDQKDNFQFVQRMGNILSVCIIAIAVMFICFFIYFMLSTHFQKIQRNLGTFKAFGISNRSLYNIYMVILLLITFGAYAISFVVAFIISFVLRALTVIEPGFMWVDVLVWQNALLLILAVAASFVASYIVVNNKLKHTPGDLIYNRNQK